MKERCIIAAVDENNAIGYNGDQLHYISRDLKRFKELTTGNIVIMGRKTFEAIGRALPNRNNIVVTSHLIVPAINEDNLYSVGTLEDAYELAENLDGDIVYVIGGGQLYKAALENEEYPIERLEMTEIMGSAGEADTYFPEYDNEFIPENATCFGHDDDPDSWYRFATYKRI